MGPVKALFCQLEGAGVHAASSSRHGAAVLRSGAAGNVRLVRAHGGSISAEHGIGPLKKDYLSDSRSPVEIELLQAVKRAVDPEGILNPGKIFDARENP